MSRRAAASRSGVHSSWRNSGTTSRPASRLTSEACSTLTPMRRTRKAVVGLIAVGDHHRHIGERQLERHGARLGHGGIGGGEGVEALGHVDDEHHRKRPIARE